MSAEEHEEVMPFTVYATYTVPIAFQIDDRERWEAATDEEQYAWLMGLLQSNGYEEVDTGELDEIEADQIELTRIRAEMAKADADAADEETG